MNLPNKLTVFRIILVPIMVIIPYLNIQGNFLGIPLTWLLIDLIFMIASYTDKLDGNIARKKNLITDFGKFLDPIADKILVLAALIILVELSKIPSWIPIIIVFREFLVSGYRLIAVTKGGKVIAASIWGKIKTVTQMIAIILCYIDIGTFFEFLKSTNLEGIRWTINFLASLMLLISVIATIISGIDYLKNGKELLKDM